MLEVWAYTDQFSYAPGETLALRVSTTAQTYDVEIGRDGADYQPLLRFEGLAGTHHDTPADCSVNGCHWPVAQEITIPDDWASGAYL
ncbi:MAG TPA: hypothetical protein DCY13_04030, partial [Verrucomicrobiales bacterium]|nr:hypothetical protein [Verrucomicrobiales bacterium]